MFLGEEELLEGTDSCLRDSFENWEVCCELAPRLHCGPCACIAEKHQDWGCGAAVANTRAVAS